MNYSEASFEEINCKGGSWSYPRSQIEFGDEGVKHTSSEVTGSPLGEMGLFGSTV